MARDFRELECWQLANDLKLRVYALIATSPTKDDVDFCSEIRRSARSAPANISEGFGRITHAEFAHFLSIAIGSLRETENHLIDAHEAQYLPKDDYEALTALASRARKAAQRLHSYLDQTPNWRRGRLRNRRIRPKRNP